MSKDENRFYDVDRVLDGLFKQDQEELKDLFDQRLKDLDLSVHKALTILGIERRTLLGILEGNKSKADYLVLIKLAAFLQIPTSEAIARYIEKLEKNFKQDVEDFKKREFILKNFDLASLVKCGFIDNISDFHHIEDRIVSYFGFETIYDYGKDLLEVAFSSGGRKSKNSLTKDFWIESAASNLKQINNYYNYDRSKLLEFIPAIRWHSMNVKHGLFQVIRELFKLGVTVIFEPYINTLYVRGATFAINNQPCIVLTNYAEFYPSLWFSLIHELHHVLFDFEEIRTNTYHISGELDLFTMREVEADEFAREYLFSKSKMEKVEPYINNPTFVKEFAKANDVHHSIIYIFYCWDKKDTDKDVWAKFYNQIPKVSEAINSLNANPWQKRKSIKEVAKNRKEGVFNSI